MSRRPKGSFVTVVPIGMAGLRAVLRELPSYDARTCMGCKIAATCRAGASRLPMMIWDVLPREHECRKSGNKLATCVVIPWHDIKVETSPKSKLYLIDANILLNAFNGHPEWGDACWWVLHEANVRIATTRQVLAEAWDTKGYELPARLDVVEVGPIDPRIRELRPPEGVKAMSDADMSLMQAILEADDIAGIITFDPDFNNVAAGGLLSTWTGRHIEVLDSYALRRRV